MQAAHIADNMSISQLNTKSRSRIDPSVHACYYEIFLRRWQCEVAFCKVGGVLPGG